MNKANPNERLKHILNILTDELAKVSKEQNDYFRKFPADTKLGINADSAELKKITTAYYLHTARISASISKMETALSALPTIIVQADSERNRNLIVSCDDLLTRFSELKKGVLLFAQKSETIITKKQTSSPELFRYLSELSYKVSYFDKYLKNISL